MKPFIYIAAFVRSGSTLLEEMLTRLPYSYVFHEPRFGRKTQNKYIFTHDLSKYMSISRLKSLKLNTLPSLLCTTSIEQIGVKEVRNTDWKYYVRTFPDTRFILTGRDPRDVYISLYYYHKRSNAWKPKFRFSPAGVYKEFRKEYNIQVSIAERFDCMKVKYEDLCVDPDVFQKAKKFVNSSIPDVGEIGAVHKQIKRGVYEIKTHKGKLTTNTINRWEQESDHSLVEQSYDFARLMHSYCRFWGYEI